MEPQLYLQPWEPHGVKSNYHCQQQMNM